MSTPSLEENTGLKVTIPKPNWEQVDDGNYNEEHVINAYLSGKESAINEISDALKKQKLEYLKTGMVYADELLTQLNEQHKVHFEKIFLRQSEFKNIDLLIVLPSKTFFSPLMGKVYEYTFEFEDKAASDVELDISYTYDLKALDTQKLLNDGYQFSREP